MNRRKFFSRVGAAGAAVAAVPLLKAMPATAAPVSGPTQPDTPASVVTAAPAVPARRDLFTLQVERGLVAPCPNCRQIAWTNNSGSLTCKCGWMAAGDLFIRECACSDCRSRFNGPLAIVPITEFPEVDTADLARAQPGRYRVMRNGRPVTQEMLNAYEMNTDGWVHHAEFIRIARVMCALREYRQPPGFAGMERTEQPNGNPIFLGWHMVDCYEWKQARGERPAFLFDVDAQGHSQLVQGVTRP